MFLSCPKVRIKTWSLTRLRLVVFHRFTILPVYDDGQSILARLLLQSLGLNICGLQHPSMNFSLRKGVPMSDTFYIYDLNNKHDIKIGSTSVCTFFNSKYFSYIHILFRLLNDFYCIRLQSQLATHYQYYILISMIVLVSFHINLKLT